MHWLLTTSKKFEVHCLYKIQDSAIIILSNEYVYSLQLAEGLSTYSGWMLLMTDCIGVF